MKRSALSVWFICVLGCAIGTTLLFAEEKTESDQSFASIQPNTLITADGRRWYYEYFDRNGRPSFAVLYEDNTLIEKTRWFYEEESSRHPVKKTVDTVTGGEMIQYTPSGSVLAIEIYDEKRRVTSKTDNTYDERGRLIRQLITGEAHTDISVWEFLEDTAVSLTKYRDGKKHTMIELNKESQIVHLYVDDKEVFVTEEP